VLVCVEKKLARKKREREKRRGIEERRQLLKSLLHPRENMAMM